MTDNLGKIEKYSINFIINNQHPTISRIIHKYLYTVIYFKTVLLLCCKFKNDSYGKLVIIQVLTYTIFC